MFRLLARSLHQHCAEAMRYQRMYMHDVATKALEKEVREIQIPVPWGHIAGKWWGPQNVKPLLCLHGYQDNAGTWDTLAPLLPPEISLLAIDFPGHGCSSHFPRGIPYYLLDFVLTVRRIANTYGWDKISLLGHSYGSVVSFLYSALYPEYVEHYIGIDAIMPIPYDPNRRLNKHAERLDQFLQLDSLNPKSKPSYTYEEAVDHLHKSISKWASREACEILSKRGTEKLADEHYCFSRDPRLKVFIDLGFPLSLVMAFAADIKCKVLYIKAKQGLKHVTPKVSEEFLKVVKKSAACFEHKYVEGLHHVHLDFPERIAPLISDFLKCK